LGETCLGWRESFLSSE